MVVREDCLHYGLGFVCNIECGRMAAQKSRQGGAKPAIIRRQPPHAASRKPPRNGTTPADVRERVRARDGACRRCGGSSGGLHVHHIKYRSELGPHEDWNLITLCLRCHETMHSNKKLYQPLLLELVALTATEFLLLPALEARHARVQ